MADRLWFTAFWGYQLAAYFLCVLISARRTSTAAARCGMALLATAVYLVVGMVVLGVSTGPDAFSAMSLLPLISLTHNFDAEFALIAAAVALLAARDVGRVRRH
jgi:hypothetical protein